MEPLSPLITKQITAAYKAGYRQRMEDCGELPHYMTMNEACEKYGRKNVEQWIDDELIVTIKTGEHRTSRRLIVRSDIETAAAVHGVVGKARKRKVK